MYELRRLTDRGVEVIATADAREELDPLLHHCLSGPDGPVVGSRYADYEVVEVEDE